MTKKTRIGLVGTGGIANAHIQAFLSVPDVEIAGLWNRTTARAEQIADKYELKDAVVYDSWEAMLDEADLDIVSVVTAPQLRAEPVIAALNRGMHVLVEKPFATTVEEALSMTEAANDSTCVTAVNFCHRYRQENLIARRIVSEGTLGSIRNYNDTWRFPVPSTFHPRDRSFIIEAEGGVGMLGEFGSHQFDMFSFITGQPIDRVSGHLTWAESDKPDVRANTAFHIVAQSTGDVAISIEHTEPPVRPTPSWTKYIEGTLGYAKAVNGSPREHGHVELQLADDEAATVVSPNRQEDSISLSTTGLVEDFIAAIRTSDRSPFLPTFGDGLRSLQVLAAASKADRQEKSVKVVY